MPRHNVASPIYINDGRWRPFWIGSFRFI